MYWRVVEGFGARVLEGLSACLGAAWLGGFRALGGVGL